MWLILVLLIYWGLDLIAYRQVVRSRTKHQCINNLQSQAKHQCTNNHCIDNFNGLLKRTLPTLLSRKR